MASTEMEAVPPQTYGASESMPVGEIGSGGLGDTGNMAGTKTFSKQQTKFMVGHSASETKDTTRFELLDYLNLQKWSRISCQIAPLPTLLWLTFLAQLSVHLHTETSFHVRSAFLENIQNVSADLTRGVPPDRVFSADVTSGSKCTCACAMDSTEALCHSGGDRNKRFQGVITLQELALLRARAEYNASEVAAVPPMGWSDLLTVSDVWFWLQHGLLPYIWKEPHRNRPLEVRTMFDVDGHSKRQASKTLEEESGIILRWNQVIRGVRMRTQRYEEKACSVQGTIARIYGSKCHSDEPAVHPYGPGLQARTEGFMPRDGTPGVFEVHLDLDHPIRIASEKIQYMLKVHRWLDSSTASLHLQSALLNAETTPPLFGNVEVRFDFERSGGLSHSVNVRTVAATHYSTIWQIVLDAIWGFLVLCLFAKRMYQATAYIMNPKKRRGDSCCDWVALLDWAMLVYSVGLAVNKMLLISETRRTTDQVAGLPPVPSEEATAEDLLQYHLAWDTVLDQVRLLVSWSEWARLSYFWYMLMLTTQFLQVFQGQPKLAQIARVLSQGAEDLLHFLFMFLVLFLNFAFGGFLIFGLYLDGWSTGWRAINTSLQIFAGSVDVAEMYAVAPISTCCWYLLFVTGLIFLMMNLLLAIAYENYTRVRFRLGSTTGMLSQFWTFARDHNNRRKAKGEGLCSCSCCKRRDPAFPSHRFMSEHLMEQSGFDSDERSRIRSSVLGVKWERSALEKAAFVSEQEEAAQKLKHAQGLSEVDLFKMGVAPEYIRELQDSCDKHLNGEYNMAQQRTSQIRELVVQAETDMVIMRERMANCKTHAGVELDVLQKRFEELEHVVHYCLEELVQLSEGAGISSKGRQASTMGKKAQLDMTCSTLRSINDQQRTNGLMTSSWKGVLDHLSTTEDPKAQDPQAKKTKPKQKGLGVGEAAEDLHRAHKVVSPKGKRAARSARADWADK